MFTLYFQSYWDYKTEEQKGNLIKIFQFIMTLETLRNQGLLNIQKMWYTTLAQTGRSSI